MNTTAQSEARTQQLAAIQNRRTLYELAMINGDQRILVAYCGRRSRHGLIDACRKRGDHVLKIACPTGEELMTFASKAADGARIGCWTIRFTGRTQRDAIMEGELAYVGDLAQVA